MTSDETTEVLMDFMYSLVQKFYWTVRIVMTKGDALQEFHMNDIMFSFDTKTKYG